MTFMKFAARYQAFIDLFIPEAVRQNGYALNQARMFLISHTMGPILGNSVPFALYLIDPTPGFDIIVLSLSITAFWIYPFLLRRGVAYDTLVLSSVLNLNFCIFWSCYFNGGVLSPTLPWVLIIPILSFFYIGGDTRLQNKLLALFAGSFLLFLTLYYATNPAPNDIPEVALVILGVVSTVAALCYVATMAIYYARIFDAGVELENEVQRRHLATDELRSAILAADRAGMLKSEFLARMSHELRTPLNAVIGYSMVLKEDALDTGDAQMQDDIKHIHDAGQYLLRLINIILDLSKIEAGRMQFTVNDHELIDVVHEATTLARPAMRENGNTMELFIETRNSTTATDKERLLQVLGAILDNAPAHAPGSHVLVTCRASADPFLLGGHEISVRDNGPGIPRERMETLFEALSDDRAASASKYGGTGLNLTVVYKLARAIGCDISVESEVGKGTCFTIRVPRHWSPATQTMTIASHEQEMAAA